MVNYTVPPKKTEMRAYVPISIDQLFRAVIEKKNDEDQLRRWTLSDGVTEALVDWLNKPENQAVIQRHQLDK